MVSAPAAAAAAAPVALPNPVFEGSEKRVELDFVLAPGAASAGLRALPRATLDELMGMAACTIVSSRANAHFDAYVLSESSLFVYPSKWVLKTCGTTRLLASVPRLLEVARAALGMQLARCKFSRASFLFPEQQPAPHDSFDAEVAFLDAQLAGHLDIAQRQVHVLGGGAAGEREGEREPTSFFADADDDSSSSSSSSSSLQWHVYVASSRCMGAPAPLPPPLPPTAAKPTFNVELCMTQLGERAAQQFFRGKGFVSSAQTTRDTGIALLKPNALVDDYVFEPCGYSMNGIAGTGLITIHVTPEQGFSYASLEVSGHLEDMVEPSVLAAAAVRIFRPAKLSLAVSTDSSEAADQGACRLKKLPCGYACHSATTAKLGACGGSVAFCNLVQEGGSPSPPSSPNPTLSHAASTLSYVSSTASDSEPETEAMLGALPRLASPQPVS